MVHLNKDLVCGDYVGFGFFGVFILNASLYTVNINVKASRISHYLHWNYLTFVVILKITV